MIDPKILGKIKKCLALSSSDNPHEAAAAMRQAHALMAAHGVSAEQITMADIGEAHANSRTMARNKPAQWEGALAAMVGKAFGCQMMLQRSVAIDRPKMVLNEGSYVFVGIAAQAQVAAYTFDVLVRKCKKARSAWIAEKLEGLSGMRGGKRTATSLGDEFAMGWVGQVVRLVHDFAHPEPVESAIAAYIENKTTKAKQEADALFRADKSTEHKRARLAARMMGGQAAKSESLHRPVNGREQVFLGTAVPALGGRA